MNNIRCKKSNGEEERQRKGGGGGGGGAAEIWNMNLWIKIWYLKKWGWGWRGDLTLGK